MGCEGLHYIKTTNLFLQVDSFTDVKVGDIVSNATVTYSTNKGVTIRIKEGITGFIPNKKVIR